MNRGIYAIICKVNGKMYIGYSFNFRKRRKSHWSKMSQNNYKGKNDQLQDDWNLYGKQNFKFVIIEEVDTISIDVMLQKEEDYIIRFGTLFEDKGYNISLPITRKYRKGFIEKYGEEFLRELIYSNDDLLDKNDLNIVKNYRYKKVYQINKANQVVRIWKSKGEISQVLGISEKRAESIIFGVSIGNDKKRKLFRNHIWVLEEKYDGNFDYSTLFIRPKPTGRFKVKPEKVYKPLEDYNIKRNPISLQNIETGEIRNFKSQSDANRIMGFAPMTINNLIKGYKNKGGGKIAKITQWKGWRIYKPEPEGNLTQE